MRQAVSEPNALAKLGTVLGGLVLLVFGIMFSVILFAVVALIGMAAWGYFRWKTRDLRRTMKERKQQEEAAKGVVIDGESIVVEEYFATTDNTLPRKPPRP